MKEMLADGGGGGDYECDDFFFLISLLAFSL